MPIFRQEDAPLRSLVDEPLLHAIHGVVVHFPQQRLLLAPLQVALQQVLVEGVAVRAEGDDAAAPLEAVGPEAVEGRAGGHAAEERAEADLLLAFGSATWPHLLARAMLAEQLYRATTIIADHPYHRSN